MLELREKYANATQYIRRKVNQLLTVMGTAQLRPEELDDATLIELDPIGIVSDSFLQILRNVKETNEQLRIAHDEITAIFDSAGMGILVLDRDMRVIAWNKKIEDQFHFDRSAAQGRFCHELLCHLEHRDDCPGRKAIETGKSCQQDMDLEGRHYNMVATPIKDKAGVVIADRSGVHGHDRAHACPGGAAAERGTLPRSVREFHGPHPGPGRRQLHTLRQ